MIRKCKNPLYLYNWEQVCVIGEDEFEIDTTQTMTHSPTDPGDPKWHTFENCMHTNEDIYSCFAMNKTRLEESIRCVLSGGSIKSDYKPKNHKKEDNCIFKSKRECLKFYKDSCKSSDHKIQKLEGNFPVCLEQDNGTWIGHCGN